MEKYLSSDKLFSNFIETRDHYFSNAEETIRKKEWRKASELLWGSITQSIKALARLSEIQIFSHKQFRDYLRQLSGEMRDEKFYKEFLRLENLHRNFYDEDIDKKDFPIYAEDAKRFIEKINRLIQKKISMSS